VIFILESIHFLGGRGGGQRKSGVGQTFYPTKIGWVTIFFPSQIRRASFILMIRGVGHVFFSKLTKGGPGELIKEYDYGDSSGPPPS